MTADFYSFDMKFLGATATRIINEVKGVNRVVYDITSKPLGTIEMGSEEFRTGPLFMSSTDEQRSHYRFHVSLRVRHPSIAPEKITEAFGIEPKHSWKAGEPRHTPNRLQSRYFLDGRNRRGAVAFEPQ